VADHLILRMSLDGSEATVIELNAEGQLLASPTRVPLQSVAERAAGRQITVALPASEFVSCVVRMPSATPARLRQMLPFTLEDEFASDIDDLHFAAGERNDEGLLAVAAISRNRFESYRAALRGAGIEPARICSEADAVPDTPAVVTLFLEGQEILGRRPGGAPFAFSELTLTDLWTLLGNEREDDADLRRVVLFVDPDTRREREAEIEAWRSGLDDLDIKELADGCLPRLAANLVHRPGVNLLQGAYASRSDFATLARPWRTAAGFLLALAVLTLAGKAATVWKLGADVDRLTDQIASVCAQSYSTSAIADCRLEMLRRLDGAGQPARGGGPGYLATQATIAEAAGDALAMQQMSYRDGVMSLVFVAPNVPFVDAFSQAVAQSGQFQVRDQRTTTRADGVETRLDIVEQDR